MRAVIGRGVCGLKGRSVWILWLSVALIGGRFVLWIGGVIGHVGQISCLMWVELVLRQCYGRCRGCAHFDNCPRGRGLCGR